MERLSWRLILPAVGLIVFAGITYSSVHLHRRAPASHRYFWWSSVRLDSDPLNTHPRAAAPCKDAIENCADWDVNGIWVDPGWLGISFTLSALPAFVIGMIIVSSLGRLGISEILSFMIAMPLLIVAWYYFMGWMIDRRPRTDKPRL
jgi:hypothetical protein